MYAFCRPPPKTHPILSPFFSLFFSLGAPRRHIPLRRVVKRRPVTALTGSKIRCGGSVFGLYPRPPHRGSAWPATGFPVAVSGRRYRLCGARGIPACALARVGLTVCASLAREVIFLVGKQNVEGSQRPVYAADVLLQMHAVRVVQLRV